MNDLFVSVLNMSLTGAFVIVVIILARLPLKKAPKFISYLLWAVAGFRLVFPFSIESLFSLLPFKSNPIPPDLAAPGIPHLGYGLTVIDQAIGSNALPPAATAAVGANPIQLGLAVGSTIWLAGVAVMLGYGIVSMILLKRQLRGAVGLGDNIYEAANLKTPCVIGALRPQIFIPAGLAATERRYIILHEQMHLRRRDPAIKICAYCILCLHWFNPFVWLGFLLMGADMEMSCDERVMDELGGKIKNAYSLSLLRLAAGRPILNGSPLAFGEGGMKERIKNVLNYKKPSRFIVIAAVILAAALTIGLALNRAGGNRAKAGETEPPLPRLAITTPREIYSPFMSSIFGFELVVQGAPPSTQEFHYLCSEGSFCSYDDGRIRGLGAEVTTAETVYWTAFSEVEGQFITKNGAITSITVTALDGEGKVLACGSAPVECGPKTGDSNPDGTAFPADDSSNSVPLPEKAGSEKPAKLIRDELIAAGYKIIGVREYGERFIEHSTITSPASSKMEQNEVTTVYAEYEDQNGDPVVMNYTLRRPVSGENGWSHGGPIPWIHPQNRLDQTGPQIPTAEPYASAAAAAREYYRKLGYAQEDDIAIRSLQADYSGESEAFLSRLKDETVTLNVQFSSDPKSHPLRAIVLTREAGGKWEVVRGSAL